jgi:hypothetical protein
MAVPAPDRELPVAVIRPGRRSGNILEFRSVPIGRVVLAPFHSPWSLLNFQVAPFDCSAFRLWGLGPSSGPCKLNINKSGLWIFLAEG